jgi:hypothetical protein
MLWVTLSESLWESRGRDLSNVSSCSNLKAGNTHFRQPLNGGIGVTSTIQLHVTARSE